MVSIEDVALKAEVGRSTVSRVLNKNGYVSDDAKKRVLKAIIELGYTPNEMARSFKNRKSRIIALMVPTINHPFFSKLAECIEAELYKNNYKILIVNSQGNKDKELAILDMIKRSQVDGIIFVTHYIHENIDEKLPIITIDRHLTGAIPYVTSDNYGGATLAVNHLLEKGCKKIGFIGGKTAVPSEVANRFFAYEDIMKKNNMPIIAYYDIFNHGDELNVTRAFMQDNRALDGLFCASDVLANCAYSNAILMNKNVPSELKIVGFDGVLGFWSLHPNLTTIEQNMAELAKECLITLMRRINNEPHQIATQIPVTLKLGETT